MTPQHSNRAALLEGTLRCLERLPAKRVTARAIAEESGANLASIAYHYGSKDGLVTAAVIEGLDRWLAEIAAGLGAMPSGDPPQERLRRAAEAIEATRERHAGLARNFLGALAHAQYDAPIRELLTDGFAKTRPLLAEILGLGSDGPGADAGGLVHSMFVGLLFQTLLDPELAIEGERMTAALGRLREALPAPPAASNES